MTLNPVGVGGNRPVRTGWWSTDFPRRETELDKKFNGGGRFGFLNLADGNRLPAPNRPDSPHDTSSRA